MPEDNVIGPIEIVQEGIFNPNWVRAPDLPNREGIVRAAQRVRKPARVILDDLQFRGAIVGMPEVDWAVNPPEVKMRAYIPTSVSVRKDGEPMKLCDYLGRAYVGMFGYELEVEGINLPQRVEGWKFTKDGSLRGESAEYVLLGPINFEELIKAFETLVEKLTKPTTKLSFSYRTSTHVHVNMLDFTKQQIQSFFYIAHLVEDVLVNYCAPIRKGNRFCLRAKDAEFKLDVFREWLGKRGFANLSQDQLKYSAINIATLSRYGSVEFRSLHGTVDKGVIEPWLSVLKNLYDIAAIVPIKEIEDIAKKSPMDILNVVFKEHLPKFHYTGMENDVIEAYERLIEIPYAKVVV